MTKNITSFKPGVSGNPNGRPKTREDLKKVKLLNSDDVRRFLQKLLDMTAAQLHEMCSDEETPAMEMMIANIIRRGVVDGDTTRLNFLFDRTIGKAIDRSEEAALKPVTYTTNIDADGNLARQVLEEDDEEKK